MPSSWIRDALRDLRRGDLLRQLREQERGSGPRVKLRGRELVNFSSNNYLGLADHPRIRAAVQDAVSQWGWGAGASQLVSGYTTLHARLCARLAALEGAGDAVLFPTGFQANLGAITALVGPGDRILLDKLCHASIVDGARLSRAELRVYPHNNTDKLARLLASGLRPGRILIATDSVFSMDGDLAPLARIVELADDHGAMLMVDEAHATGVLGDRGSGALDLLGLKGRAPIIMGTLSKALGGIGGFVAGSGELCDLLRNRARSGIYTTALPPAAAAAALAAIDLVAEEPWRRQAVRAHATHFRVLLREAGVSIIEGPAAIVPVVAGSASRALRLSAGLLDAGMLCPAIRPPTVARGTSRLRFSFMATHSQAEVTAAAEALASMMQEIGDE